ENPEAEKFDGMGSENYTLFKDRPPINLALLAREFLVGDALTDDMKRQFLAVLPDLRIFTPQGEEQHKFLGSVWAQIMNAAALQHLMTNRLVNSQADVERFSDYFLSSCGAFFLERDR
ncbi:hypothetical protein HZB96_01780, partial [Candidatus Gottesmanbacteria bacterium]|nr:hypothetical protein [Candidatus Gottesmanbacteria bacterium]